MSFSRGSVEGVQGGKKGLMTFTFNYVKSLPCIGQMEKKVPILLIRPESDYI